MMKNEFNKLEIKISAPRCDIWKTATDFTKYSDWNTIVPYGSGTLKKGHALTITLKLNGKSTSGRAIVNEVVPQNYFILSRKMIFKWLLYMEHSFIIEQTNDSEQTFVFAQTLKVSGILKPLTIKKLKRIWSRFQQMNVDLKNYLSKNQNNGFTTRLEKNSQIF